jgi:hypothetical protein
MNESTASTYQGNPDAASPVDTRAVELMATLEVGMMTNRQYLEALKQTPGRSSPTEPVMPIED